MTRESQKEKLASTHKIRSFDSRNPDRMGGGNKKGEAVMGCFQEGGIWITNAKKLLLKKTKDCPHEA